jgi:cytochrome c556
MEATMNRHLMTLAMATAIAAGACTTGPAPAPAPSPAPVPAASVSAYTPVVSLNEMMVYVVDWHAEELWDATMVPPKNDAEWAALRRAAVALAASGSLTKLSGSGPKDQQWTQQADWIAHSQSMADAGLAMLRAVEAKDTMALNKAGDALVITCITCHREYKLDVPKIWTERQLPPEEQK